jgi:hypothetical protein
MIRFEQEAEVVVHPKKADKPVRFQAGEEAELFPGVEERLIRSRIAKKIERPRPLVAAPTAYQVRAVEKSRNRGKPASPSPVGEGAGG